VKYQYIGPAWSIGRGVKRDDNDEERESNKFEKWIAGKSGYGFWAIMGIVFILPDCNSIFSHPNYKPTRNPSCNL